MTRERGRPRGFVEEEALDRALKVFWARGFQGASLTDLTGAMGVSRPSLYAAFGDKEALYLRALRRYVELEIADRDKALEAEPDGRRAVEEFLRSIVGMLTDPRLPGGCFVVTGVTAGSDPETPAAVIDALAGLLRRGEDRLRTRLERAQRDGHLAPEASPEELATFFMSLWAGLAVLARTGASRAKLDAAVTSAMAAWPPCAPRSND